MTRQRSGAGRRAGLTLTEVLVALFVAALGLISLMTLFPLGALQLGQALKDDRCAQTAAQADGFLRQYWQQHVVEPPQPTPPPGAKQPDPFKWAMDDPNLLYQVPVPPGPGTTSYSGSGAGPYYYDGYPSNTSLYTFTTGSPLPPAATGSSPMTPYALNTDVYQGLTPGDPTSTASPQGNMPAAPATSFYDMSQPVINCYVTPTPIGTQNFPSYPVMVDPLGYLSQAGTGDARYWVGYDAGRFPPASSPPLLARRNFLFVTTTAAPGTPGQSALQVCSLLDDVTFAANGTPDTSNGQVTRQGRYNWAAIIQRPKNSDRLVADLKILVFDGRPPLYAPPRGEVAVTASNAVTPSTSPGALDGDRSLLLDLSTLTPAIPTDAPPLVRKGGWLMDGTVQGTPASGLRNANFYRIVGVTPDPSTPLKYTIDIEPPIRPRTDGQTTPYTPTIYLFAGLAEVFSRPQLADLRTAYTAGPQPLPTATVLTLP